MGITFYRSLVAEFLYEIRLDVGDLVHVYGPRVIGYIAKKTFDDEWKIRIKKDAEITADQLREIVAFMEKLEGAAS